MTLDGCGLQSFPQWRMSEWIATEKIPFDHQILEGFIEKVSLKSLTKAVNSFNLRDT